MLMARAKPNDNLSIEEETVVAGIDEPDLLTREQVQDVYDKLERLITEKGLRAA